MTINFTGLQLRCNLRISFLIKYSPCLPRNGILTHILEMFSSAMLLELFSEISVSDLVYCPVCVVLRKTSIPDSEISKSKKCTFPFSNLSTVKFRFLSKLLNFFRTEGGFSG